jgi:hypothetical protein
MFKATHFIITPHAGNSARGVGFSPSPQKAIALAKVNADLGLTAFDAEHGIDSNVGGEVTNLFNASNGVHIHQDLDL